VLDFEIKMSGSEKRASFALASIMSIRMLGLFMILPVFALYARHLPHTTPTLVGIAIGIYGLTQAIFQIPFGMLSDRFGRKPVILIGLLIFLAGSVIAALSTSIMGIIIGRAIQGSGAISAVVLALTADLTREENRTKAMAILGMSIGASFLLALVIGPIFNHWIGVQGIFWITALFAGIGIVLLYVVVPQPVHSHFRKESTPVPEQFKKVLKNDQLIRLNFGILVLHSVITALFVVIPIVLKDSLGIVNHWKIYLFVLLAATVTVLPFIFIAEKYRLTRIIFISAIAVLSLTELNFAYFQQDRNAVIFLLYLFFTAFSILEANLPSLISRVAPADGKGTAMGIYSSFQFFGAFLGGLCGGWLQQQYSINAVFLFCAALSGVWFIFAITMEFPNYLSSYVVNIGNINKQQAQELAKHLKEITGVIEAVIIVEDKTAYLKVDRRRLNTVALNKFFAANEIH
jgi:MFS family permease